MSDHPNHLQEGIKQAALEAQIAEMYVLAMYPEHGPRLVRSEENPLWVNALRSARFFITMTRIVMTHSEQSVETMLGNSQVIKGLRNYHHVDMSKVQP